MAPPNCFTESINCTSQEHCETCRRSKKFRTAMLVKYGCWDPVLADEECPRGYTAEDFSGNAAPDRQLPALTEQAKEFAGALGRVGKAVLHGEAVLVSTEEQERRLKMCRQCAFLNKKKNRCSQCGCFVEEKAWLATETCDRGYWNDPEKFKRDQAALRQKSAREKAKERKRKTLDSASFSQRWDQVSELLKDNSTYQRALRDYWKTLNQEGGCSGCRKNKAKRKVFLTVVALYQEEMTAEEKDRFRSIFEDKEYIVSGKGMKTWSQL